MSTITTEDLIKFYDYHNECVNQKIAIEVIEDFGRNVLGKSIKWEIVEEDLAEESLEIKTVLNIINTWGYDKDYSRKVFSLLARYGYRMNREIIDAMGSLGTLENPNQNKEVIKDFLLTPLIDDISFNGKNTFTIISEKLGNLTFRLANKYFQNNPKIVDYIKKEGLETYCHKHTELLAETLPEFYSITSLCDYYFKGSFYHSYSYNKQENVAIDLCCNAVLNIDDLNHFYGAKEIMRIPNKELDLFYQEMLKNTKQPEKRYKILKMALYEQLKQLTEEQRLILQKKRVNKNEEENL